MAGPVAKRFCGTMARFSRQPCCLKIGSFKQHDRIPTTRPRLSFSIQPILIELALAGDLTTPIVRMLRKRVEQRMNSVLARVTTGDVSRAITSGSGLGYCAFQRRHVSSTPQMRRFERQGGTSTTSM